MTVDLFNAHVQTKIGNNQEKEMMKIKRPLVEQLITVYPERNESRKRTKRSKGHTCGISSIIGVLQKFRIYLYEREFKSNLNDPVIAN
jgi:hypothetical protein